MHLPPKITMTARTLRSQMSLVHRQPAAASLRPLQHRLNLLPLSEDMDLEDEEDEERKEVKRDSPLSPATRDTLRLTHGSSGTPGTSGDYLSSIGGLEVDSDAFNPDWALLDIEVTSLAFGKKTVSFLCKSRVL